MTTPPTAPEARRITPDCQPTYPCWLWNNVHNEWHHATLGMWTNCDPRKSYTFTHWHPEQPEPPAPLAGGTVLKPSTATAEVAAGCKEGRTVSPAPTTMEPKDIITDCQHDYQPWPAGGMRCTKCARVLVASPATGEREAELRAILHGVVTIFCASASSYLNGYSHDEAVDELLSALTPLLDRREGELAAKDAEIARLRAELKIWTDANNARICKTGKPT